MVKPEFQGRELAARIDAERELNGKAFEGHAAVLSDLLKRVERLEKQAKESTQKSTGKP